MEVRFSQPLTPDDVSSLRTLLNPTAPHSTLQQFGTPDTILMTFSISENLQQTLQDIKVALASFDSNIDIRRVETVGPQISRELILKALLALSVTVAGIFLYIWIRFEWQFSLGAVLALIHDVLLTMGLFALFKMEFNVSSVAALLTILGYSINDTVVLYDCIRENVYGKEDYNLQTVIQNSVLQTLPRTLMTSLTTLLALLMLLFFGGQILKGFAIALIFGVIVGTYSSIFIASALLFVFKLPPIGMKKEDKDVALTS